MSLQKLSVLRLLALQRTQDSWSFSATGDYDLFVNGIKVEVRLTQDEPADTRRNNVVEAINLLTHTHGIIATNNNSGVTLESTDGRNMSVWFDGSVQGLSAASFGLDQGELLHKPLRFP